jgi:hypothetical protein
MLLNSDADRFAIMRNVLDLPFLRLALRLTCTCGATRPSPQRAERCGIALALVCSHETQFVTGSMFVGSADGRRVFGAWQWILTGSAHR